MAIQASEIEDLIRESFPDAKITIKFDESPPEWS